MLTKPSSFLDRAADADVPYRAADQLRRDHVEGTVMADHMKKPCAHCPFRRDVRPFLHPARAAEIALSALNKYNDFPCHKTFEFEEDESGESYAVLNDSKTCAGFMSLAINDGGRAEPDGWEWSEDVYADRFEMVAAYESEAIGRWVPS